MAAATDEKTASRTLFVDVLFRGAGSISDHVRERGPVIEITEFSIQLPLAANPPPPITVTVHSILDLGLSTADWVIAGGD